MAIVPMHEWKVPLKYRAMLLFPSGPLGLGAGSGGHHGLGGGTYEVAGTEIYKHIHTETT